MPDVKPLIDVRKNEGFLRAEHDVNKALAHVSRFATAEPISSWEEAGEVADAIKGLKLAVDRTEERRKEINRPYEATTKHVNAQCKELLAQAKAALDVLSRKAVAFKKQKEEDERERQRKEQERLDREAEQRAMEAQKAAELVAKEPTSQEAREASADAHAAAARAATATASPRRTSRQVRGAIGAIGTRTDYPFTVTDRSALPADFLMPNEKAITAAITGERAMAKAQNRAFNLDLIPGVTITPQDVPVRR